MHLGWSWPDKRQYERANNYHTALCVDNDFTINYCASNEIHNLTKKIPHASRELFAWS